MPEIRKSKSIIELNLASNEISNEGMIVIFQNLADNDSVISINLSTIDGVARNRISQTGIEELATYLRKNNFIEMLDLSSISLGNEGLEAICDTLSGAQNARSNQLSSRGASFGLEREKSGVHNTDDLPSFFS